jgi:hypothetical protein
LSAAYVEGLKAQGILGDKSGSTSATGSAPSGKSSPAPVDYAEDPLLPRGFTTRRAG